MVDESETKGDRDAVAEGEEGAQAAGKKEVRYAETPCPKCGNRLVLRRSRAGRFWGCEKYPECDGVKPYTIGVPCPRPGCGGEFVERRSKRGRLFYGCSNYPTCTETTWTYPGKKAPEGEKSAEGAETAATPSTSDSSTGE